MYNCSREWQVQRCCLGKFLPTFGWDVSSEGRNRGEEETLNLKLLPNSMILQNLSYPAAFNWAVLLNIVFCFSFAVWLWLFEFSSSLLHSVCLGSFPASFSLLLALCSLAPLPACSPALPAREPERSLLLCCPVRWGSRTLLPLSTRLSTGCIRSLLFAWLKSSSFTACFRDLGERAGSDKGCCFLQFFSVLHLSMHLPPISLNLQQKDRQEAGGEKKKF